MAEALEMDSVLHVDNIRDAIKSLQEMYRQILRDGKMPAPMREVPIAMLYKNKGDRCDLGDPQVAFQSKRKIGENIDDRVQWPFMQATMEAFGVPKDFQDMVGAMYAESTVRACDRVEVKERSLADDLLVFIRAWMGRLARPAVHALRRGDGKVPGYPRGGAGRRRGPVAARDRGD